MQELEQRLKTVNERIKQATGMTIAEIVDEKLVQLAQNLNNTQSSKEIRETLKFLKWYESEAEKKLQKTPENEEKPPLMEE